MNTTTISHHQWEKGDIKMTDKVTAVCKFITWVASGTSVAGAMINEFVMAYGGFVIASAAFLMNWYYNHRRLQLAKAVHDASIKAAASKQDDSPPG